MNGSKHKNPESTTSFQRFEDLTKRLLNVPKEEADAKMEEIAKANKRRRGKEPQ